MHVENSGPDLSVSAVPDYTLRKKYTKRPAHVIKIRLRQTANGDLKLPEDDVHRMWIMMDDILVVIKTWHYGPLPSIISIFKGIEIENVAMEFNLGPHVEDTSILEEFTQLDTTFFSLEFREHWAGLYPTTSGSDPAIVKDNTVSPPSYSDEFLEPFLRREEIAKKIKVLTGRITVETIKKLSSSCSNLNFLGLRVNHEEYCVLTDLIHEFASLERIHLLPQWKHDPGLKIPPVKFTGVVTIYYWDLETTQSVKKALKKWKRSQGGRRRLFCWSL